jgi:hypothetical protein
MIVSLFSESAHHPDFAFVAAVSTTVRLDINKIRFGIISIQETCRDSEKASAVRG